MSEKFQFIEMSPPLRGFIKDGNFVECDPTKIKVPSAGEIVDATEAQLLEMQRAGEFIPCEAPVTNRFGPGVYLREILMRAFTEVAPGVLVPTICIGHKHRTTHFNIVLAGRAVVSIDGKVEEIKAGDVFLSGPGVRKVLLILEDMRWMTVHPTDETDVPTLEAMMVEKSDAFLGYEAEVSALQTHASQLQ